MHIMDFEYSVYHFISNTHDSVPSEFCMNSQQACMCRYVTVNLDMVYRIKQYKLPVTSKVYTRRV